MFRSAIPEGRVRAMNSRIRVVFPQPSGALTIVTRLVYIPRSIALTRFGMYIRLMSGIVTPSFYNMKCKTSRRSLLRVPAS